MRKKSWTSRSRKSPTLSKKKAAPKLEKHSPARFIKRVQNFANRHDLWMRDQSFIIGVSGGPDSLCLLDVMARLAPKYDWHLHIAHVNYRLRGADSLFDEKLVKEQTAFYNLPCTILRPRLKKTGSGEEPLRDTRYLFFENLRLQKKADAILVAHNKNDQAETLLLRLLRGSGLQGLSAMRPKTGRVIRPLLSTSRQDIYKYLSACHIPFRQDQSNTDPRFLRNRIRHELIPYLEKNFVPNIQDSLARSAGLLSTDYQALEKKPGVLVLTFEKKVPGFSRNQALLLPETLLRRELRHLFRPYLQGKNPPYSIIEETVKLLKSSKGKVQSLAFRGLILRRVGDRVRLLKIFQKDTKTHKKARMSRKTSLFGPFESH